MERSIYSLINEKDIQNTAKDYAEHASINSWETHGDMNGYGGAPFGEANEAENFLDHNPQTKVKPYIYLFLIFDYRFAFECFVSVKNYEAAKDASEKYQRYLKIAKGFSDPLIGLIAEDIDHAPYLILAIQKHP